MGREEPLQILSHAMAVPSAYDCKIFVFHTNVAQLVRRFHKAPLDLDAADSLSLFHAVLTHDRAVFESQH